VRADERVVTKIPLTELWDASGTLVGHRISDLSENSLVELMRSGSMQFVVADCGLKLDWISRETPWFDAGLLIPRNLSSWQVS
jgi:hypothetical protein